MIKVNISTKDLLDACLDSQEEVKKELYKEVNKLARAAQTHLIQLAKEELNSHQYQMFVGGPEKKNISLDSPGPGVHVITIREMAVLIDNGEKIDMKTDKWLFKSKNTKQGKNGKYLVIPFEHGGTSKSESASAKFENALTGRIKEELEHQNRARKANGLSRLTMGGLERYPEGHKKAGEPKEGLLHSWDIVGHKKSNWSESPLTRLNVYQKIQRDEQGNPKTDKSGKVKAARSFMTFRTASEGKPDKFWYPAPDTKDFLARTGEWAEQEFLNKIIPELFAKWKD